MSLQRFIRQLAANGSILETRANSIQKFAFGRDIKCTFRGSHSSAAILSTKNQFISVDISRNRCGIISNSTNYSSQQKGVWPQFTRHSCQRAYRGHLKRTGSSSGLLLVNKVGNWTSCDKRDLGEGSCARALFSTKKTVAEKKEPGRMAIKVTEESTEQSTNENTVGNSPKIETATANTAPSKKSMLKQAVKDYGATVIVFHVAISLVSLGFFYLLVSSGLDMVELLKKIGVGETILQSKITQGASTFVIAYAVHKVFAPIRITITLTATPLIVRKLRASGILKKPIQK